MKIDGRDRAFGPVLCCVCGDEHGANAPDCPECRAEAEAQREALDRRPLDEALSALRWIASNADVPPDFPNAHVRLRQIAARANEALADARAEARQ